LTAFHSIHPNHWLMRRTKLSRQKRLIININLRMKKCGNTYGKSKNTHDDK
jgi:hypothetical protein